MRGWNEWFQCQSKTSQVFARQSRFLENHLKNRANQTIMMTNVYHPQRRFTLVQYILRRYFNLWFVDNAFARGSYQHSLFTKFYSNGQLFYEDEGNLETDERVTPLFTSADKPHADLHYEFAQM
jgi:hypothetical protein